MGTRILLMAEDPEITKVFKENYFERLRTLLASVVYLPKIEMKQLIEGT